MISLAGRDILHAWGKFVFTGFGLGLLIGVTLVMAGVSGHGGRRQGTAGQQRRRSVGGAEGHPRPLQNLPVSTMICTGPSSPCRGWPAPT